MIYRLYTGISFSGEEKIYNVSSIYFYKNIEQYLSFKNSSYKRVSENTVKRSGKALGCTEYVSDSKEELEKIRKKLLIDKL